MSLDGINYRYIAPEYIIDIPVTLTDAENKENISNPISLPPLNSDYTF